MEATIMDDIGILWRDDKGYIGIMDYRPLRETRRLSTISVRGGYLSHTR